jgi:hypothetical protein
MGIATRQSRTLSLRCGRGGDQMTSNGRMSSAIIAALHDSIGWLKAYALYKV